MLDCGIKAERSLFDCVVAGPVLGTVAPNLLKGAMGIQDAISRLGKDRSVPPGFLRPINTDQIAQDLRIEDRAAEYGAKELPTTDAHVLDAVEQSVVQKLEGEWTWQSGELINVLRSYAARLVSFSIDTEFAKLKIQGNNALTQLRALNARAPADLGPLQEAYIAARQELADFKSTHRLVRPARDPQNRWTAFGILVVLIAFESAFNGAFFAKGSAQGWIGGIGTAIGISFVNVAVAFLLGLVPTRWLCHKNLAVKFFGFIFAVGGVACLIVFHAFAAHLREATLVLSAQGAVSDAAAMRHALSSLTQTPFQFSELYSLYLFLFGVLLAALAMWKGYRFDDPYPGYGAVMRRFVRARDDYSDEHGELFDGLEDVKETTINDLRVGIDRIPRFPQEAANIRVQRDAVIQTFRQYETSVATACNQLLARYRQTNRISRKSPAPSHFNEQWSLSRSILESSDVRMLLTEADTPQSNIALMMGELHDLSGKVLAEYEDLLTRFPHATQMV